jgi:hypothetical protein
MKRGYSRLSSVEEKRNIRGAYFYVLLSIAAVIFLFFLGLPTLIKFAGFLGELGKSSTPIDNNDITPPAPPQFEKNTEYTNVSGFTLKGVSEDGAVITLIFNEEQQEIVANSDGGFSFDVDLVKGENTFAAEAKDRAGNVSQQTDIYRVFFDDEAPELVIESPNSGSQYYGSGQRQVNIKGTTSDDADIYINDRFISVNEDKTFSFTTTLTTGENKFEIKAKDLAGNETKSELTLSFSD